LKAKIRGWWFKETQDPILTKKPGIIVHVCDPSYAGGMSRRTEVGGEPRQKALQTPFQPIKAGHGGACPSFPLCRSTNRSMAIQA
jgi:hypothetical protein